MAIIKNAKLKKKSIPQAAINMLIAALRLFGAFEEIIDPLHDLVRDLLLEFRVKNLHLFLRVAEKKRFHQCIRVFSGTVEHEIERAGIAVFSQTQFQHSLVDAAAQVPETHITVEGTRAPHSQGIVG